MKKIILLISIITLTNCNRERDNANNEARAIAWIKEHKKPILCMVSSQVFGTAEVRYTLISNDGQIYNTGTVIMSLPDTLK